MARPLWSDAGTDPAAVADHLEHLAETATRLQFEPRPLPPGTARSVLRRAAVLRAGRAVHASHGEQDRVLAQEVRAIDDLVRASNLLIERLREWYSLHAPEATRTASDARDLARLVAEVGDRTAVAGVLGLADGGLGTDMDPADVAVMRGFAAALQALHDNWAALERRVDALMEQVAPNVASVVGPVLGARLIAQAGNLERLATMPAGTVQTLGAETALFRHIKEGTKPPKHGILFQHPFVHTAPPWQRGAIARTLALHAGLGAKADAFTKNDLREHLKLEVETDLERIRRDRAKAPRRREEARGFGRGPPGKAKGFGPRPGGAPSGPRGKPGGRPYKPGGKPGGASGGAGKPYGKPGSKPGGRPGGKPYEKRDDRRGERRDDRKKGPGAFRGDGGPARPPGGGRK